MTKLFNSVAELAASEYVFHVTDNGGSTADRYTIVLCDGDHYGSSANPPHPQGFFQSGGWVSLEGVQERVESGQEKYITFAELPEQVQQAVVNALNYAFEDTIAAELSAASPALAHPHDGIMQDAGTAIYKAHGQWYVKLEQGNNDAGPFDEYRWAFAYTLPDKFQLAGDEYFPEVEPFPLAPQPA